MKRSLIVLPLLAAFAAPAAHAAPPNPSIHVSPSNVPFGHTFTVTGKHWPVIEFCSRNVRFSLRKPHHTFHIGNATVSRHGRFTFTYKVKKSIVVPGKWRVRANLACESGQDGSPNPVRVSARIHVG